MEDLFSQFNARREHVTSTIGAYGGNQLLNTGTDALVEYFFEKYKVYPPAIVDAGIHADQREVRIDVSNNPDYDVWPGQKLEVPGTEFTITVPIEGEFPLVKFRASTRTSAPPRARVGNGELVLVFQTTSSDGSQVKQHLDGQLAELRRHLEWTAGDTTAFNTTLPNVIRTQIEARKQRLLQSQNTAATLGYPLKPRSGAPTTYAIPDLRRKVLSPPPANSTPFVAEPALDDSTYSHILTVLSNMVRVMEQSPEAFNSMEEQDLRTHFLVQLNGQFEGRATAETFRGSGKTDILLTEKDKSVFIAECKFWKGEQSLSEALDQILDYATWRDSKVALLLFNRNADFSGMLAKVPTVISSHSATCSAVQAIGDNVFQSRLRQREDSAKEIILTTMVFNVPILRSASPRLRKRSGRAPQD